MVDVCCCGVASVCRLSVRNVLWLDGASLLLTAYRNSHMRNRLVPKWKTLTFV